MLSRKVFSILFSKSRSIYKTNKLFFSTTEANPVIHNNYKKNRHDTIPDYILERKEHNEKTFISFLSKNKLRTLPILYFENNFKVIEALDSSHLLEFYRLWSVCTNKWTIGSRTSEFIFEKIQEKTFIKNCSKSLLYQLLFSTTKLLRGDLSNNVLSN